MKFEKGENEKREEINSVTNIEGWRDGSAIEEQIHN